MKRSNTTTTPMTFAELGLRFDPATRTYHRLPLPDRYPIAT